MRRDCRAIFKRGEPSTGSWPGSCGSPSRGRPVASSISRAEGSTRSREVRPAQPGSPVAARAWPCRSCGPDRLEASETPAAITATLVERPHIRRELLQHRDADEAPHEDHVDECAEQPGEHAADDDPLKPVEHQAGDHDRNPDEQHLRVADEQQPRLALCHAERLHQRTQRLRARTPRRAPG